MTPPTAGSRPLDRLRPVGWAALAVAVAFTASVLTGALAASTLPVLVGTVVTRSGMDVAGVGCVGLTLLAVLLPAARRLPGSALRDLDRVRRSADRALVVLAGIWLVLSLLGIAFRTADAFGRPLGQLSGGEIGSYVTELAGGRGLVLAALCTAAVLVCAVLRLRDRALVPVRVPLVAALLGLMTPGVTGHSGTSGDHQIAIMTIGGHIVTAALWVGGLAAVLALVARHRALLDAVLPRFSRLAGWCLGAVAVTGLLNALLRLGAWSNLLVTDYGRIVLAKAVCLGVLAFLGNLARRRLASGRTPVLRWAGVEVAVMAATLGLAAALSQSAY
jgi:putative copper resistance protein D